MKQEDIQRMRELRKIMSCGQIGKEFHISRQYVSKLTQPEKPATLKDYKKLKGEWIECEDCKRIIPLRSWKSVNKLCFVCEWKQNSPKLAYKSGVDTHI